MHLKTALKRHRLIHPIVTPQHLRAIEPSQSFRAGLGHVDEAGGADGAPHFAKPRRVAQKKIVILGSEHLRETGIALPRGTPEKLTIDAAAGLRFGADHVQAAEFSDAAAKMHVGAAAGHVRGDG